MDCRTKANPDRTFDLVLKVKCHASENEEDSPVYLPRSPLGKVRRFAFCIKKLENFPVGPGVAPPVSRVDLVPAETA
ncbi:DENN domain-containing protein 1B isoform X3 [Nomascus leucogenys]|uniref:DENN domain-containing protein 1B isoform X3 n=1 Tax=Nomascus leucogenys TaxID=61853 RepID=UPI00122D733A|nr:DENN domain-containing protein 1B isoform X3 [Nomascus leucogenys]XP_055090158.1 DENN domain-containing protein 1B isoform X7 [Symphalangus syndactylus]